MILKPVTTATIDFTQEDKDYILGCCGVLDELRVLMMANNYDEIHYYDNTFCRVDAEDIKDIKSKLIGILYSEKMV